MGVARPRRHVRDDQPAHAGARRMLAGLAPGEVQIGEGVEQSADGLRHLAMRDIHAQAAVLADAEAQVRLDRPVDVESAGIVPAAGIVVRCAQANLQRSPGRNCDALVSANGLTFGQVEETVIGVGT